MSGDQVPQVWREANAERFARLGAMVTRETLLLDDLDKVRVDIAGLKREILAIESTCALAAEVERRARPEKEPPLANGHVQPARAT